jgi:hypothetical protein
MAYDLAEHRHRFAVWAAARATQRGFTTVRNLRAALGATDIRRRLDTPSTFGCSAAEFDEMHLRWCSTICSSLTDRGIAKKRATHGRAAKLVAVYLKALVLLGERWDSPFAHNMHPPVDRILLQGLATSKMLKSSHQSAWRSVNWTELDRVGYESLIGQLRAVVHADKPFWIIEEYWEPSDSDDAR